MIGRKDITFDLLVLLAFAVIPFVFYGTSILMFNNSELYLNPPDFLHRVSYIWDTKVPLGGDLGWGMGGFFPFFSFFAFFSYFGLPIFIVDKMWLAFLLFLSGASMYFLISVIIDKANRLAKIIAGLAYMYSLYVIINMMGSSVFLTFYGILPTMLGLYIRSLNTRPDIKSAALLILVSMLMSAYNPTLILINFLVLALYFIFHMVVHGTKNLKNIMIFNVAIIAGYICVNLYWILPTLNYSTTIWWAQAFSEPLTVHNAFSSYHEVFRLLGSWGFYSGYAGVPYYQVSPSYLQNPLLIVTTMMVPIVALASVLFKTRSKYRLFFAILLIICVPMAVATYPPQDPFLLGKVYKWAYENVPFFNVFRNNYKFVMPITLAYCAMIGFVINDLRSRPTHTLRRASTRTRNFIVVSIIILIFINSWPMYTGRVIDERMEIKEIPQYWYAAADWMNNLKGDGGLFILPGQYGAVYTWGTSAGPINVPLFNRPQIYQSPSAGSVYELSSQVIKAAYAAIEANSTEYVGKILGLMGVEYILQRNDVAWQYYGVQSPDQVNRSLANQIGISFEKTFGALDFYRNNYYVPHIYAADRVVYVNGSIDLLSKLSILKDLDVNSSVLFFSEPLPDGNNQTLKFATNVVSLLENSGETPLYLTNYPWRGKFFEHGAKGHISALKIFETNMNMTHDGYVTLGFSRAPNEPEIFNLNVSIPKGSEGWVYANVDRDWNFDSIFVYRYGDPTGLMGLDYGLPYDGYFSSDGINWSNCSERYLICLEYNSAGTLGSEPHYSYSKPASLIYKNINPAEYAVEVDSQKPFFLILSESYNPQWEAYINGERIDDHFISNGYSNSWYINRTGQFEVTLKYAPQAMYDFAKIFSILSLTVLVVIIIFPKVLRRRLLLPKNNWNNSKNQTTAQLKNKWEMNLDFF